MVGTSRKQSRVAFLLILEVKVGKGVVLVVVVGAFGDIGRGVVIKI